MRPDVTDLPTTRGLLMALSRRRSGLFVGSLPGVIVAGVITLGVEPLLKTASRLDAWRRFEWLQLREFATWLERRSSGSPLAPGEGLGERARSAAEHEDGTQYRPTERPLPNPLPKGEGARLAANADRFAEPLGVDWTLRVAAVGSLAIVALAGWHGGLSGALDTAFQPQSLRPSAIAHSALLSLAWAIVLARLLRQHARLTAWLATLSATFVTLDRRPVAARPLAIPWIGLALASVLAIVGPTWSAAMVATVALQNSLIRGMRQGRLQLVERMLELEEDSGLPVEFDVETAEPDAFVTARVA